MKHSYTVFDDWSEVRIEVDGHHRIVFVELAYQGVLSVLHVRGLLRTRILANVLDP